MYDNLGVSSYGAAMSDRIASDISTLRAGNQPLLNGPELSVSPLPLLLLDIDGVLSPLHPPNPEDYQQVTATWVMHFLPGLSKWLAEVTKLATPVWATSWQDSANLDGRLRSHLGLPELPWINFQADGLPVSDTKAESYFLGEVTSKLRAVSALGEALSERPLVWCEDDARADAFSWIEKRNQETPSLLVRPEHQIGLTDADLDRILIFLRSL